MKAWWWRFRGAAIAAAVCLALAMVLVATRPSPEVRGEGQVPIFRFEREDVVGLSVVRPEGDALRWRRGPDGEWVWEGSRWRPSQAAIRKVAHQLHALTARAPVASADADLTRYGLGSAATRVSLSLADGTVLAFEAGDPNPTGVSYYVRVLPDGPVYVVQKSALDLFHAPVASFREDRFASLDAADVDGIDAVVDGRHLVLQRSAPAAWEMTAPVVQAASREVVREILGRVAALRAEAFLLDGSDDLARYGLAEPRHRVAIARTSGPPISLEVGDPIPGTDPPRCAIRRVEDDAVYDARCGFLDAFRGPLDRFRNRRPLRRTEPELARLTVGAGDRRVAITRTADAWRWPSGAAVAGATPRRLAGRILDLEEQDAHAPPPSGPSAADPWLEIGWTDATVSTLRCGPMVAPAAPSPAGAPGAAPLRWVWVEEAAPIAASAAACEAASDLLREAAHVEAREAERRIPADGGAPPR